MSAGSVAGGPAQQSESLWLPDVALGILVRIANLYKGKVSVGPFQLKQDIESLQKVPPRPDQVDLFALCYDRILEKFEDLPFWAEFEQIFHDMAEPWFDQGPIHP